MAVDDKLTKLASVDKKFRKLRERKSILKKNVTIMSPTKLKKGVTQVSRAKKDDKQSKFELLCLKIGLSLENKKQVKLDENSTDSNFDHQPDNFSSHTNRLSNQQQSTMNLTNKDFKLEFFASKIKFVITYSSDMVTQNIMKKTFIEDITVLDYLLNMVDLYKQLMEADKKKARLEKVMKNFLDKEIYAWRFFFTKNHKQVTVEAFEKSVIYMYISYCASHKLKNWAVLLNEVYFMSDSLLQIRDIDIEKIICSETNNNEIFIKTIQSLNIARFSILNYLCERKCDILNIQCKQLISSKYSQSEYIQEISNEIQKEMFTNKDNYSRIQNIFALAVEINTFLSFSMVPSKMFDLKDSMENFEEKCGRLGSIDTINFEISKAVHGFLKIYDL